jgi:hypothetical protein
MSTPPNTPAPQPTEGKYSLDCCHGDAIVLCDGIFFAEAQDITCAQQIIDALNQLEAWKKYAKELREIVDGELGEIGIEEPKSLTTQQQKES